MLNAFAPRRGSLRGLRLMSFHSSSHPSAPRVSCDGMDTLFRDLHDSPSGDKSDPAPRAGKESYKTEFEHVSECGCAGNVNDTRYMQACRQRSQVFGSVLT